MKFDKTQKVLDFYGKPVLGLRGQDDKDGFTYAELFVSALGLGLPSDRGDEKLKSYSLGLRFLEPDPTIDLADLDTVRLKSLTGALYNALLHGRACEFLDHPLPAASKVVEELGVQ